MSRSNALLQIRPNLNIKITTVGSEPEKFQNTVLRPILKFQHELLCYTFLNSPLILKQHFENKNKDQKRTFIIECLKSNQKLKSQIVQSVVSMMTINELSQYYSRKAEYQKRIISMASMRLIDGLIENN
jgi:hypothetical protein